MLNRSLAKCKVLAPLRPAAKSKFSSTAVRNGGLPKRYVQWQQNYSVPRLVKIVV